MLIFFLNMHLKLVIIYQIHGFWRFGKTEMPISRPGKFGENGV